MSPDGDRLPVAADGPSALRAARKQNGATQEQLAELSGVSVRSIRGLESGKINNPHRSTLLALADGLFGGADDLADEFLRVWTTGSEVLSLVELFDVDGSFADQLTELRARLHTDLQLLSVSTHSRIGPRRTFTETETTEVVRALHDGVDRRPLLHTFARDRELDVSPVVFDRLANCTQGERIDRNEFAMIATEMLFGRALRAGQTHVHSYRLDSAALREPPPRRKFGSTRQGIRRRMPQLLLQVTFDGRPPDRIWEFRGPDSEPVGPLEPDTFGTVHLIKHNVEPGFVGFAWEWDD